MITAVAGAKKSAKSIFVRHGGVFVTHRAREWGMPGGAASVHQRACGLCSCIICLSGRPSRNLFRVRLFISEDSCSLFAKRHDEMVGFVYGGSTAIVPLKYRSELGDGLVEAREGDRKLDVDDGDESKDRLRLKPIAVVVWNCIGFEGGQEG